MAKRSKPAPSPRHGERATREVKRVEKCTNAEGFKTSRYFGPALRHERFVAEYLIDLNKTAAYKRAGYRARGHAAEVNASRLSLRPAVRHLIMAPPARIVRAPRMDIYRRMSCGTGRVARGMRPACRSDRYGGPLDAPGRVSPTSTRAGGASRRQAARRWRVLPRSSRAGGLSSRNESERRRARARRSGRTGRFLNASTQALCRRTEQSVQ